jgi:hypothetical protein
MLAFGNQVQPPLVVARFYLFTSLPHPTASGPQPGKRPLMLPDMILRLCCGDVNSSTKLMGCSLFVCGDPCNILDHHLAIDN